MRAAVLGAVLAALLGGQALGQQRAAGPSMPVRPPVDANLPEIQAGQIGIFANATALQQGCRFTLWVANTTSHMLGRIDLVFDLGPTSVHESLTSQSFLWIRPQTQRSREVTVPVDCRSDSEPYRAIVLQVSRCEMAGRNDAACAELLTAVRNSAGHSRARVEIYQQR